MPGTPHYPRDLGDVISQMQRDQQSTRTAAQSRRRWDNIKAGNLSVVNQNGDTIAKFGDIGSIDGKEVWGVQVFRTGGSEAIRLVSSADGTVNYVAILDRHGHIIFSDDGVSSEGIATPHIPYLPPRASGSSGLIAAFWPRTANTSFTTVQDSYNPALSPRIRVFAAGSADTGNTGEIRALINGTQVGPTVTIPSGGSDNIDGTFDMPGWGSSLRFHDEFHFELQIRRTAGSNNVYGSCFALYGQQS